MAAGASDRVVVNARCFRPKLDTSSSGSPAQTAIGDAMLARVVVRLPADAETADRADAQHRHHRRGAARAHQEGVPVRSAVWSNTLRTPGASAPPKVGSK